MVASLALEGVGTNMLLLLEWGRSHPDTLVGTNGLQLYLYRICTLYTVYCIEDTVHIVQFT